MTYASATELQYALGDDAYVMLFDDDNDGSADTAIVTQVLTNADSIVGTLNIVSGERTIAALDIAMFLSYRRRGQRVPAAVQILYNEWIARRIGTISSKPCWNPEEQPKDESDGWFDRQTDNLTE